MALGAHTPILVLQIDSKAQPRWGGQNTVFVSHTEQARRLNPFSTPPLHMHQDQVVAIENTRRGPRVLSGKIFAIAQPIEGSEDIRLLITKRYHHHAMQTLNLDQSTLFIGVVNEEGPITLRSPSPLYDSTSTRLAQSAISAALYSSIFAVRRAMEAPLTPRKIIMIEAVSEVLFKEGWKTSPLDVQAVRTISSYLGQAIGSAIGAATAEQLLGDTSDDTRVRVEVGKLIGRTIGLVVTQKAFDTLHSLFPSGNNSQLVEARLKRVRNFFST